MNSRRNGYERVHEIGRRVDVVQDRAGRWWDRLARLEDVPPDVCPRREAVSGACIFWVCVFALVWAVIGCVIWGWT